MRPRAELSDVETCQLKQIAEQALVFLMRAPCVHVNDTVSSRIKLTVAEINLMTCTPDDWHKGSLAVRITITVRRTTTLARDTSATIQAQLLADAFPRQGDCMILMPAKCPLPSIVQLCYHDSLSPNSHRGLLQLLSWQPDLG